MDFVFFSEIWRASEMESSDESSEEFAEECTDTFPAWESDVRLFVATMNSAERQAVLPGKISANQDKGVDGDISLTYSNAVTYWTVLVLDVYRLTDVCASLIQLH